MSKQTIIIIGAGVAGLVAARQLAATHHIILLEANDRAGGRIHTYRDSRFTQSIEGGAEFLHGDTEHTLALLREAGIEYEPIAGNMYRSKNGQWQEEEEMVEGWGELIKKMGSLEYDMTLRQFMDEYYSGPGNEELRAHLTNYAEGFDSADVNKASTMALYNEWSHDGEQCRVKGGYGLMVDFLLQDCKKQGCEIHLGNAVKDVKWQQGNVQVTTTSGQQFTAAKCIITVPISILQLPQGSSATISIQPIPSSYKDAIANIGFGTVVKVVLEFSEPLWKEDTGFIFCDEAFPTWWTQLPSPAPILTMWAGGPRAEKLATHTNEEISVIATASLAKVFSLTKEEITGKLLAIKIFNWSKAPTAQGSYSYATPASLAARQLLSTPIEDTIYFAGEGLYQGPHPATVEAAIANAMDVVKLFDK